MGQRGTALKPSRRRARSVSRVRGFAKGARSRHDLAEWRRARAVISYVEGKSVIEIAENLGVTRGSVNRWLQWYNVCGLDGLRTGHREGRPPRLTMEQKTELGELVEAGSLACGFDAGIWTGPMIGELIRQRFGVQYHSHHVPRILHSLGFSVQRPRKRLARADAEKQEIWVTKRFLAIKKKREHAAASCCSKTKRASGLTAHCIRHGRGSANSLV